MLKYLNHVAIVVPDLEQAIQTYQDRLACEVSIPQDLKEHGVRVAFISLENTKIELLEPLGETSPVAGFLKKNPRGGMHHLCFDVENVRQASEFAEQNGARSLGAPKVGAHGKEVIFLHPHDFCGVLVELEES
ncbi:MAG: methylmalonyl-CoA epimerase [bacterium]|nr:methylmalonyl-CoA epimerase [bacterium]